MNYNLSTNHLVNEINDRILERTTLTGNINVLIPPRPESTLFTLPFQNSNVICNPIIIKSDFNDPNSFLPSSRGGDWNKYKQNIDTESILRSQVYALQNAPQAIYVPNSNSDLYNSTMPTMNTSTAQGLYKNLQTTTMEDSIWGLHPALNINSNYQNVSMPDELRNKLFNNDTRQEIKNK
jgi:hypothetical protein